MQTRALVGVLFTDLMTVGNISDAYRKMPLQQPAIQNFPIQATIVGTHLMSVPSAGKKVSRKSQLS